MVSSFFFLLSIFQLKNWANQRFCWGYKLFQYRPLNKRTCSRCTQVPNQTGVQMAAFQSNMGMHSKQLTTIKHNGYCSGQGLRFIVILSALSEWQIRTSERMGCVHVTNNNGKPEQRLQGESKADVIERRWLIWNGWWRDFGSKIFRSRYELSKQGVFFNEFNLWILSSFVF